MKYVFPRVFAGTLLLFSASIAADYSCTFDLRLGVVTSKNQIRVLGASRTLYQINNSKQLFIGGRLTELSSEQAELVRLYANGMQVVVPEITLLAREGVTLVTDNMTRIYSGLVGQNNESISELYSSMKKVKYRVKEKFGHTRQYHYIDPGKLEMSEDIENSIQAQIESGFSNVSGILTAIGTFDTSNTTDNEDSEDEFRLRKRARKTCNKLKRLDSLETALQKEVPALAKMDVIIDRREF